MAMKIDYTLPGLLPAPVAPPAPSESTGLAFRSRLAMLRPQPRADWRELLRLDRAPAAPIGPPPRPAGLESTEGPAQRAQWQHMLERHSALLPAGGEAGPVGRMMALLFNLRDMQQAVVARHLATTQE